MQIKSLFLKGYKPLALNNIDSIHIDVESYMTLILGSNGSGKSSLLRESTAFPPVPSDYRQDGEKRIVIEHNDSLYELISVLAKGGKHTFIKDGKSLLTNATTAMFRELVISEFNYYPIIHKLLIGEIKFTTMTASARRDILTMISPLDLVYAGKLHVKIKEQVRDNQGALKHLVNKLADAKMRLMELNIPDELDINKRNIEEQLQLLIPFVGNKINNLESIIGRTDSCYEELTQIKKKLEQFKNNRVPVSNIKSVEALVNYIGSLTGETTATQTNINNLVNEIELLTGVSNSITDSTMSPEDLKIRINQIQQELNNLGNNFFVNSNHDHYLKNLLDIVHEFEDIYSNTRELDTLVIEKREEIINKYENLNASIMQLKIRITDASNKLLHYNDTSIVANCPKCQLQFDIRGEDILNTITTLTKNVTIDIEKLVVLETEFNIYKNKIEHILIYDSAVNKIQDIKKNFYIPFEFWEGLINSKEIIYYPLKAQHHITKWEINLRNGKRKIELEKELQACLGALDIFLKYDGGVNNKLLLLQQNINNALEHKKIIDKKISDAKQLLSNINKYVGIDIRANQLLIEIEKLGKYAIDTVIQLEAKKTCEKLYSELASSKNILDQRNNLLNSIKEMEKEFNLLSEKQKSLLILEEHLSPNKGIIADQMLGFMASYIEQINTICRSLWAYHLEVGLCNMDNGVLDYNFPLHVEKEIIKDISYGSDGQKDIIDLAFMIVMRQYMGLTDYPIYLDEIDRAFDSVHRSSLLEYIKNLKTNKQCSQVFMINHSILVYGGLVNHEVIVLDSRNIVVPSTYNEKVVITYAN